MNIKLVTGKIRKAKYCCCALQEVGSSLSVRALNAASVPLAVDKCISFISLYGMILEFVLSK